MSKKNQIPWEKYRLEFEHENQIFRADITYWAKDYSIDVIVPYEKKIIGPHIMFMIPVIYSIHRIKKPKIKMLDLISICKERIISEYNS
jgi:hypothetical protein